MFDSNGADRFQILSLAAANEPGKPGQQLREYQLNGISNIKQAYANGARRVLMVLPTGGGKTSCFVEMVAQYARQGKRALILVHRRELAIQASERLGQWGIDFGFIMRGMPKKPYAPVQIATVQTLSRRDCPKADFVVCDEAHLSAAESWTKILAQYPRAHILGVTATPFRLAGVPLAEIYDATVVVARPAELRNQGFLSPFKGFSYKAPDMAGVEIKGGDFNEKQSGERMRAPHLVANIVEEWKAHASNLSTVVFATTIEHSKQITEQFKAAGVRAEHLDGKTDLIRREAILRRVESGETQVLVNVGVLVEGIDVPRLKCCVLARPTMSMARAIQMMGRVRRPYQGMTARIHDHAFNIKRHGLPDIDLDYTLHARSDRNTVELPVTTTCPVCFAVYEGGGKCPEGCEKETRGEQDRTLRTVDDAEKFEFEGEASGAVERAPVEIRWTDVGKSVSGVYRETFKESTQWGDKNRHLLEGEKRRYVLHGTADLDARMKKVRPGKRVRVTFQGTTSLGQGMARKDFTVEVDEEKDTRWEKLEEFYRVNRRCPSQRDEVEKHLGKFEGSKIKTHRQRILKLRKKYGVKSQYELEDKWRQLETFYKKFRRFPSGSTAELKIQRFEQGRLEYDTQRLITLRSKYAIEPKLKEADTRLSELAEFYRVNKRAPSSTQPEEKALFYFEGNGPKEAIKKLRKKFNILGRQDPIRLELKFKELEDFYKKHRRCPKRTSRNEKSLGMFENLRLKTHEARIDALRKKYDVKTVRELAETQWTSLETFYSANGRNPNKRIKTEKKIAQFANRQLTRNRDRLVALRKKYGIETKGDSND